MSSTPPPINESLSASENKSIDFTQALNEACKEWQIRLNLQDWIVKVSTARAKDLDDESRTVANNTHSLSEKYSHIRVLDPVDIPLVEAQLPEGEAQDYDLHLVHELLHLHFAWFQAEDNTRESVAQEQAINSISRSLVKAYRSAGQLATPPAVQAGHYF